MLNAKQIIEQDLLKLDYTHGKPAQVGYDLSIQSVQKVVSSTKMGFILKDKTILNNYTLMETKNIDGVEGWLLHPGAYDITFHEGCKITSNRVGMIRQRSSLLRNGAIIASSIFDPGFETENMGTIMIVTATIFIEQDARVGQMYFHECDGVSEENLYNGQWQNDKQR
jgi:deoxycytidine triphosphate deaminase